MVIRFIYISVFIAFIFMSQAQSAYSFVKKGNKQLEQENYTEAEILYRKSLDKSPKEVVPLYNIGVSQYLNGNMEQANEQFTSSAENFATKEDKAHAYHNLGNSLLSEKKYKESIEAYKNALKLVPNDMDTKYNLAYAQLMLKKEQEQQQQNQDNKDQNQDQNQDNKDQENQEQKNQDKQDGKDEQKDKKDGEDKENKDGQNGDKENKKDEEKNKGENNKEQNNGEQEKEQPAQPKEMKLSKEQADKLLKALENEEGKLQEKLDKPEGDPVRVIIEKDW